MRFEQTPIPGAFVISLSPYSDERGAFSRLYCENELKAIGHDQKLVQINHSLTREKATIRGMHFQHPPDTEVKIIRCLRGKVFDVMVDLRTHSPAFLQWHAVELTPEGYNMVYIPEGCAHGFQTLEQNSELLYFHTAFYKKENEGGIRYDDPRISINWPLPPINITAKDMCYPLLDEHFKGIAQFSF